MTIAYNFDLAVDQVSFRKQVKEYIELCTAGGKVLGLPIHMPVGKESLPLFSILLSQVDCQKCNALCCKREVGGKVHLMKTEFERLSPRISEDHFGDENGFKYLNLPCGFLKNNRCTIYGDRPYACIMFPLQFGARDGHDSQMVALASNCPEARRITRAIYMTYWRITRNLMAFKSSDLEELIEHGSTLGI